MVLNTTDDIYRKCRQKLETIQRITGGCRAQAHDDTHRHSQIANIVHKELATKCGLPNGPPMQYYKYEPQTVMANSNCKLYMTGPKQQNEQSVTSDRFLLDLTTQTNKHT